MKLTDIQIRDPFVLPVESEWTYYLFGTTDKDCWDGPYVGFDCYSSRDLEHWEGPHPAFRPPADFWADANFWAPEVFAYRGRFYMFATFADANRKHRRGTQVLVSDRPAGPYLPWSEGAVTPEGSACLDGTLHIDGDGRPWMVFCHEWQQIHDGAVLALRLSDDLKSAVGEPVTLFHASNSPWVHSIGTSGNDQAGPQLFVTDGPFLYRTREGTLLMLWSSFGGQGYAMGLARSQSGEVLGPWKQQRVPLWMQDGGHGMIFRTFDGRLLLSLHVPNDSPNERALFREIVEADGTLCLK